MVLTLMSVAGSLACGVLRPHPRWSKSTTRWRSGSNIPRAPASSPDRDHRAPPALVSRPECQAVLPALHYQSIIRGFPGNTLPAGSET